MSKYKGGKGIAAWVFTFVAIFACTMAGNFLYHKEPIAAASMAVAALIAWYLIPVYRVSDEAKPDDWYK